MNNIMKKLSGEYKDSILSIHKDIETLFEIGIPNMPFFTLHNIKHSERVCGYADMIANMIPKRMRLNELERYLLFSSCLCHDVGMLQRAPGEPAGLIRKKHHDRSVDYILGMKSRWFADDMNITEAVARVSKAHRILDPDIVVSSEYKTMKLAKYSIRFRLISAILRIADEMDVTSDRAPMILFEQYRSLFDAITLLNWLKHIYITRIEPVPIVPQKSNGTRGIMFVIHSELPEKNSRKCFSNLLKPHVIRPLISRYKGIRTILLEESGLELSFDLAQPVISRKAYVIDDNILETYKLIADEELSKETLRLGIEYEDEGLVSKASDAFAKIAEFEKDLSRQFFFLRVFVESEKKHAECEKDSAIFKLSEISLDLGETDVASHWLRQIHDKTGYKYKILTQNAKILRSVGNLDESLSELKTVIHSCRDKEVLLRAKREFVETVSGYIFATTPDLTEAESYVNQLLKTAEGETNIYDLRFYKSFIIESLYGTGNALECFEDRPDVHPRLALRKAILLHSNDRIDESRNLLVKLIEDASDREDAQTERNARRVLQMVRDPDAPVNLLSLDPTLDSNKLKLMESRYKVPNEEIQDTIDYRGALELASSQRYREAIPRYLKVIRKRLLDCNIIGARTAAHHLSSALNAIGDYDYALRAILFNGSLKTIGAVIEDLKNKNRSCPNDIYKTRFLHQGSLQYERITMLMIEKTWDIIPDGKCLKSALDNLEYGLTRKGSSKSELDVKGGALDALTIMSERIPVSRQRRFMRTAIENCLPDPIEKEWWTIPQRALRFLQKTTDMITSPIFASLLPAAHRILEQRNPHLKSELLWTIAAILSKNGEYKRNAAELLQKLKEISEKDDMLRVKYQAYFDILTADPSALDDTRIKGVISELVNTIQNDRSTRAGEAISAIVNIHKIIPRENIPSVVSAIVRIATTRQQLTINSRTAFHELQRFIELGGTRVMAISQVRRLILRPIMEFIIDNFHSNEPPPLSPFNEPPPRELAFQAFLPLACLSQIIPSKEMKYLVNMLEDEIERDQDGAPMIAYILYLFSRLPSGASDSIHRIAIRLCYHQNIWVRSNALRSLAMTMPRMTGRFHDEIRILELNSHHEHFAVRANTAFAIKSIIDMGYKAPEAGALKDIAIELWKDGNYQVRKIEGTSK